MTHSDFSAIFSPDTLQRLFPEQRTDQFFEALFGDPDEGAYQIRLAFEGAAPGRLDFAFQLHQRNGRCLACNLTYGLPKVFTRHPVIDVNGLVKEIGSLLNGDHTVSGWQLGSTREISRALHIVPLVIRLDRNSEQAEAAQ